MQRIKMQPIVIYYRCAVVCVLCVSVCLSLCVCLSQSGAVLKRLNQSTGSHLPKTQEAANFGGVSGSTVKYREYPV